MGPLVEEIQDFAPPLLLLRESPLLPLELPLPAIPEMTMAPVLVLMPPAFDVFDMLIPKLS